MTGATTFLGAKCRGCWAIKPDNRMAVEAVDNAATRSKPEFSPRAAEARSFATDVPDARCRPKTLSGTYLCSQTVGLWWLNFMVVVSAVQCF